MSHTNGSSFVIGNGSDVVDDCELVRAKPAMTLRRRSKLDNLSETINRARRSLYALETIRTNYAVPSASVSTLNAVGLLAECVEEGAIEKVRTQVVERQF